MTTKLYEVIFKRSARYEPEVVGHIITDDPVKILESPPPGNDPAHPGWYVKMWKAQGAPVRAIAEGKGVKLNPLVGPKPIKYLAPVEPEPKGRRKSQGGEAVRLAEYFVKYYLKRKWTRADIVGMHVSHAKKILGLGYTFDQVTACLDALDKGELTDGVPWEDYTDYWKFRNPGWFSMLPVLYGEPPAIERFLKNEKYQHPSIQEPPPEQVAARGETPTWAERREEE